MLLINRLKRAVKKVRVLLNFNAQRWRIAMMIKRRSFDGQNRLSFNERPGLIGVSDEYYYSASEGSLYSRSTSLQRTRSYEPSDHELSDVDIDKRAENFIENFRRQLLMERQASLELQYCRGNSFNWNSP